MTYRDRPIQCPRCSLDLVRTDARDRWRCTKCNGALLAVREVVTQLVVIAPDLVPDGGIGDLSTLGRRSVAPTLPCGVCGAPMEPVFLGGVELDRCYHDQVLWLDGGELELVLDVAQDQRDERRGWLDKLLQTARSRLE